MPWGEEIEVGMAIGKLANFFTLDDPDLGQLDGEGVLDGNLEPVDITEFVMSMNLTRGRSKNQNEVQAGVATIVLNNNDRRFDPINEASPYWDDTVGRTGVQPRRKVTLRANDDYIFVGAITEVHVNYTADTSTAIVEASDDFVRLANLVITVPVTPAVEIAGNRISTVLDLAEVAYPAGNRSIATGGVQVQALEIASGTNALQYMQSVALADQALLFIDRDGVFTYTDPLSTTTPADIVATFVDIITVSGQVPYQDISTVNDQTFLYNKVITGKEGGADYVSNDIASQAQYGISTLSYQGLLLENNEDVENLSLSLLAKYALPIYRFDDINFVANALSQTDRDTLTDLDIADTVKVVRTFATGSPLTVEKYYEVANITQMITPSAHTITVGLGNFKTLVYIFTLDDPEFGKLSSSNALG